MLETLVVMGAGALGALSRWSVGRLSKHLWGPAMPFGTLIVNVLGCLLFGFIMQIALSGETFSKTTRLALTTGFLGAFTTFSTFGYETFEFVKNGQWIYALGNVTANLLLGLLAVWLGVTAGKWLIS